MSKDALEIVALRGGFKPAPVPPGFGEGQLPPNLPLVQTLEAEKGPWQLAGKYGRQQVYQFPPTLDSTPTLIFNMDRQPGPPRARTLHLFREDSALHATGAGVDIYAQVIYGVGGVSNRALLDWTRGGQISLVCDSVAVQAVPYVVQDNPYSPPGDDFKQVLGAMLGHDGPTPHRPPTLTTQQLTLAVGASGAFLVPDFARWVYPIVLRQTAPTGADLIFFRCNNGPDVKIVQFTPDVLQMGTVIPGGSTEVIIKNNGALPTVYACQFELGL